MPSMRQLMESVLESEILEEASQTDIIKMVTGFSSQLDLVAKNVSNIPEWDTFKTALDRFVEANAQ